MNPFIPELINKALKEHFDEGGKRFTISDFKYASGGCINTGGVMDTSFGKMFIKWNDRHRFPKMFEVEFKGLQLLRSPNVIKVPEPLLSAEAGEFAFLVTEYISSSSRSEGYWDFLGANLAALHEITSTDFGLDHDNYIGSLPQVNNPGNDWIEFYINNRLEYQVKMAIDDGKMGSSSIDDFQRFYSILHTTLPKEIPSLLHGDLWSGNLMTGPVGEPVIFDPAVYYGNREIDIAMTRLFGGFSNRFYEVYNESFPLLPGYEERIDIYQLYPLLVHVNLFGGGYISQVKGILKRYL